MLVRITVFLMVGLLGGSAGRAQRAGKAGSAKPLVYVDAKGVLRYTANKQEAAFFGVNYTVPFAYGYRSHKKLGVDLKKAIDDDLYHLARLGIDAFRVHVWDTEITDSIGNLLDNAHLDLFDYLVSRLKARNIKILLTPIAFWGNGYPEKDDATGSFSARYGKQQALVNDTAIRAQENYVRQFFTHVNPYTGVTYTNDPDIIATEINNEPNHSGALAGATHYVNRLAAAIRSVGWIKPVFYNISESPAYAAAIAAADINGVSFQWYPTGLVANRSLQGNLLPNVDRYAIPYDTIPAFRNKARVVYEFDAGDVLQPVMYPAMARSFRTVGFQWATQFAYDPMYTAYANTEYQTHYLNLVYTPAKAISLMIANKVFHQAPRFKSYGSYPADTVFEAARVSHDQQLSEWNTATTFYYTGNTATRPLTLQQMQHLAGTGNSPVVQYSGSGAYFLDKIEEGVWRLELMPDVIELRDPFGKAAPSREVRRVKWNRQYINVLLPDLGAAFTVSAVDRENGAHPKVSGTGFMVSPGTYLLVKKDKGYSPVADLLVAGLEWNGFAAPAPFDTTVYVNHTPYIEVTAGKPVLIKAIIAGVDSTALVWVEGNKRGGRWFKSNLQRNAGNLYSAVLPADLLSPGMLSYRIIVQQGTVFTGFPGDLKGDPYAWDNTQQQYWETYVAPERSMLGLLNVTTDKDLVMVPAYTPGAYVAGDRSGVMAIHLQATAAEPVAGVSRAVAAALEGRRTELPAFNTLVLRARAADASVAVAGITLVTTDAAAFTAQAQLTGSFTEIELPLAGFRVGKSLLLPRPYPAFQPLWFAAGTGAVLDLNKLDKVAVTGDRIEIESLWLKVK